MLRTKVIVLVMQLVPGASDDAVLEFMHVMAAENAAGIVKNPDVQYALLYKGSTRYNLIEFFGQSMMDRETKAMAEVIRTGASHEPQYHDYTRANTQLESIVAGMKKDFGRDGLLPFTKGEYVTDPALGRWFRDAQGEAKWVGETAGAPDSKKACEMFGEFLKRVLSLPPGDAADIYRLVASRV